MNNQIETIVQAAVQGDQKALEQVVLEIQDLVYNLAVRMLWHPGEAQDAAQEVLIRVVTKLGSFRQESALKTWVFRIASNTLINYNRKLQGRKLSFEEYARELSMGQSEEIKYTSNEAERKLLLIEAKVGCSNAMLQCLNDEQRMVYIIGEILEMNSREGAYILDISPENFRKRLSRARARLHAFLQDHCGIVNLENSCRCRKKVDHGIRNHFIEPGNLLFVKKEETRELIDSIETIQAEVDLYRTNPTYAAPPDLLEGLKRALNA